MQSTIGSTTTAEANGVHAGRQTHPRSNLYWFLLRVRGLFRDSMLCIAWRECCNLPRRIRWVSRITKVDRLRGDEATHRWMAEALIPAPESRQSDCIAYIRKTLEAHPFLSSFDMFLLTRTWIDGSEWVDRNVGIMRNRESQRNAGL